MFDSVAIRYPTGYIEHMNNATNNTDTNLKDLWEAERLSGAYPKTTTFTGTRVRSVWGSNGACVGEVSSDGFDLGTDVRWDNGEVSWVVLRDLVQWVG